MPTPEGGSHTFEVLAAALEDIHFEYQIHDMIVKTTTDSGYILKAFRMFREHTEISESELEMNDEDEDEDENTLENELEDIKFLF